jgi:hypothetical protein
MTAVSVFAGDRAKLLLQPRSLQLQRVMRVLAFSTSGVRLCVHLVGDGTTCHQYKYERFTHAERKSASHWIGSTLTPFRSHRGGETTSRWAEAVRPQSFPDSLVTADFSFRCLRFPPDANAALAGAACDIRVGISLHAPTW